MADMDKEIRAFNKPSWLDVFSTKPVIAIVLTLAIVLIGVRAVTDLPILQFPKLDSASIEITTPYVGASAEIVQGFVTDPIEKAAASVPGIDYIDSATTPGLSRVTVWLNLNVDSAKALAELSARLDQIRFELPQGAEDPAIQVVRADRPFAVFYLTVLFDEENAKISRSDVSDYLSRRVVPNLSTIPGVQRVNLEGGRIPAMRIWLDNNKMNALNVSADDVATALRANNLVATIGRSENDMQRISLMTNTSLQTAADFESLIVRKVGNSVLRISDFARVELGETEGETSARFNKDTVLYISVWP